MPRKKEQMHKEIEDKDFWKEAEDEIFDAFWGDYRVSTARLRRARFRFNEGLSALDEKRILEKL